MLPVTDTSGNKNSNDKKFSSKSPPTDTFVDESDDDDVLNEKVSNERKIKSMEKAQRILSKCKTNIHYKTNIRTKTSWLMHTISHIIMTTDKIMQPHKYKFENTRETEK